MGLWITSMFSDNLEIVLGFILIFTFGILHGSNDLLIINALQGNQKKYTFFKVLMLYLLTVFAAIIVFYLIPIAALLLFVLFSSYHFGQQQWESRKLEFSPTALKAFYFIYGLLILELLFVLNQSDVIEIVQEITAYKLTPDLIFFSFIVSAFSFILISIYAIIKASSYKKIIVEEFFYLIVLAIIFKVSTLIWGFTIYFIFWHSIPSLFEQVNYVYGNFNRKNFLQYCKNAFPYWMISIIGITILYFIFKEEKIFTAIFFSFIAAITFPHALIMNTMFSKNAKGNHR